MKKIHSVIIGFLIVSMLIGSLAGCVAEKDPDGSQNTANSQQTEPESILTTVPQDTEPNATQPDAFEPTEPDPTQSKGTDPSVTNPVTEPEATDPATEPDATVPPTEPEDPTEPSKPTEPEPTQPPVGTGVTYLEYYAMSAEEQQAFIDSFGSLDAFFAWHTAAKEEYESGRTPIDGGSLNP